MIIPRLEKQVATTTRQEGVILLQQKLLDSLSWCSCINCGDWNEAKRECYKWGVEPPPEVIAVGCPSWLAQPPF